MARRYSCKAKAITQAGVGFAHGIGQIPDEWAINLRGPSAAAAVLYVLGAPDSTYITVCASGAAGTGDVFCWYNHSIVE